MAKNMSQAGIYVRKSNGKIEIYRLGRQGRKGGLTYLTTLQAAAPSIALRDELAAAIDAQKKRDGTEG